MADNVLSNKQNIGAPVVGNTGSPQQPSTTPAGAASVARSKTLATTQKTDAARVASGAGFDKTTRTFSVGDGSSQPIPLDAMDLEGIDCTPADIDKASTHLNAGSQTISKAGDPATGETWESKIEAMIGGDASLSEEDRTSLLEQQNTQWSGAPLSSELSESIANIGNKLGIADFNNKSPTEQLMMLSAVVAGQAKSVSTSDASPNALFDIAKKIITRGIDEMRNATDISRKVENMKVSGVTFIRK